MEEITEVYLTQEETEESKCGEVFRSILGKYSVLCSHCHLSFICLDEFSQHIEIHYQLISITTVNEPNDNDTFEIIDDVKNENLMENTKQENLSDALESDDLCDVNLMQIKQERRKIIYSEPVKKKAIKKKSSEKTIRIKSITTDTNLRTEQEKKIRKKQTVRECEKKIRNKRITTKVKRIDEWVCDICKKIFKTKYNVGHHIMSVHFKSSKHTPFLCDTCGKSFQTKSLLHRHSTVHTGERKYSCDICNRAFTEADKMRIHRRVHTGFKPYSCSWEGCDKRFTAKKYLRNHENGHSGIKKYKCNYCDMMYVSSTGRHAHEKSVHRLL